MKPLKLFLLIALSVLTLACEKQKEEESPSFTPLDSAFLTASNFTNIGVDPVAENEIESKLYSLTNLWNYYDYGNSSSEDTTIATCMTGFKIIMLSSESFYIGGETDLTPCLAEMYSQMGITLSSAKLKLYQQLECDGQNLTSLEGVALSDLSYTDLDTACGNATQKVLTNSKMTMIFSYQGQTFDTVESSAKMTATGQPCMRTFNGTNWEQANGCYDYIGSHDTSGNGNSIRIGYTDLVISDVETDPFFVSGSADVNLGGWDVTITYNGVNTDADYSYTDGSTSGSGTLSPTPVTSFSLSPMKFKAPKLLKP